MKKKVNVFGKGIPVFAIVIMGLALVSAALVPYLSGMVTGNVTVESPLTYKVIGGDTDTTWSVVAADAFNEITQDFTLTNNADTSIEAIVETNVTSDGQVFDDVAEGESFSEFEKFLIGIKMSGSDGTACTDDGGIWSPDSQEYCYWDASVNNHFTGVENGVYYVQMGDKSAPTPISAGATIDGRVKLQFKVNVAPGTYTFESQALTQENARDLEVM